MEEAPLQGISVLLMMTTLNLGGVASSLRAMVSVLLDLGASLRVCAITSGGPLEDFLSDHGVPVQVLGLPKWTRSLRTTRGVAELLRREAPMVVHTHCYEPNFHASRARHAAPVPWLFITHHDPRMRLHRVVMNYWLRDVPDRIVVVSRGLGDLYRRWCGYSEEKLCVLPNAVDVERFRPAPRDTALAQELGLGDAYPVVGNVGGFGRPKGQAVAVRALAELTRWLPRAKLVFVGDGKHRPRVESLARRLGVHDRIVFAGRREDVPRFLTLFDVYVQPSWTEADPVAVKEALAAGRPVVSTATIGPRGFITHGETGLLVPIGHWRALAQSIRRLAEDKDLAARLGRAGRAYAEVEFTHETYRRRLVELYAPVVQSLRR